MNFVSWGYHVERHSESATVVQGLRISATAETAATVIS